MDINFSGLVKLHSVPTSEPLLPLYEAIVNSIQSIQQRVEKKMLSSMDEGLIEITVERDENMTFFGGDYWETDIENIIIQDNGIGFNDDNFKSFNTYASDEKKKFGCKGVGRMIWLRAFSSVHIDSIYSDGSKYQNRIFDFDEKKAVSNNTVKCIDEKDISTSIKLIGLRSKLKNITPKKLQTIARDILNHCFIYFVTKQVPKIIISDEMDVISINQMFDNIGKENISEEKFTINETDFKLVHFKNYNPNSNVHKLNLCANERSVTSVNLQKTLIGVNSKFSNGNDEFIYVGYITSEYLDENVNTDRTEFNISNENENLVSKVAKREIISAANDKILKYLESDIKNYNEQKHGIISEFVNRKHPRYRTLLKYYPECVNNILLSNDNEKLELELFKQEQIFKLNLKSEGINLKKTIKRDPNIENINQKTTELAKKLSDLGKSNLAEYIVQRKAVLDVLENNLNYTNPDSNKYIKEESIHQLVFPMQTISDDIDYLSHNLWLIDEKLSYHYYLASDIKLKNMKPIESNSLNKPDILIFDTPFAFTNESMHPFGNITIIEFKRPGRDDYSDVNNPIDQVIRYMEDILNGKIKTKNGGIIDGCDKIRFYCYILCDLTNNLKLFAKGRDFHPTPDNMGYFTYLKNYNASIEIISYNKMVQDSKMRNKILFDKLFNQ